MSPAGRPPGRRKSLIPGKVSLFCSSEAFNWSSEAHPHQGGQSALFSLLITMLISSRNNLIETSRIMFDQVSGHTVAQSSWHVILAITSLWISLSMASQSLWRPHSQSSIASLLLQHLQHAHSHKKYASHTQQISLPHECSEHAHWISVMWR